MSLEQNDIEHWQKWVGKNEISNQIIDFPTLERYSSALGENFVANYSMPSLAHWAFFLQAAQPDKLGPDGHPLRGGFMPPISLPRRMFAASDIHFHEALKMNINATKTSNIASVTYKNGKSGELILVEIDINIEQEGKICIQEKQTIVFRQMDANVPNVVCKPFATEEDCFYWQPNSVDLFRFSAVTFNSHRIHYDLPYTKNQENYPNLVVHGPFIAAKLFEYAQKKHGSIKRFTFRAQAPLFEGQKIIIQNSKTENQVVAIRCDGVESMIANFEI